MESMNLIDSSSVTDAMQVVWSTDLAKKYPHLPWRLLNEPFEVEALTAADVVLSVPAALWILGPEVAGWVLEFIANGTIRATPIDKILLDGEPSSPAVDAVCHAVEQGSRNSQPPAVVAALLSTTMTGAQMLVVIAQQQPVAAAINSATEVPNTFGEMLRAIKDDVSIIEATPFLTSTTPQSLKIGVLHEVHPCGGLVNDFPGEELILSDHKDKE
uniref:Uncharacterized protein n=1 Tax=Romanomermis culicivorax TaxID=13658 RepID=A0A915HTQ4_ROMCU